MIYPIVLYGDQILKKPAENIEPGSVDVKQLTLDMFETMYQANGVGLAAPQIGKSLRMFVVDSTPMDEDEGKPGYKKAFINPEIIKTEGETWAFEEGCLSIPGVRADVLRPSRIEISYLGEDLQPHTEVLEGLPARIVLHEYDHIEGVLFTDHVKGLKKRLMKGKLQNISKGQVDASYKVRIPAKVLRK